MTQLELFLDLGLALAIGLLIGVERGWKTREAEEGGRFAGLRTFGLIGLLGGLWGLIAREVDTLLLGFALLGFTGLMGLGYYLGTRREQDYGFTTEAAALVAFALGALVQLGQPAAAAAMAVVTVTLLSFKVVVHGWLRRLEPQELRATLQLLLISVVLLPILPDRGYGPWQALNPYVIWWMVVLIAAISLFGYFAVKIAGPGRGILFTAAFGGLAASTAVTLSLARMGRENAELQPLLAAGVLLASSTMFPRLLVVVAVVSPALLPFLLVPVGVMAGVGYLAALLLWRSADRLPARVRLAHPFELATAVKFGAVLALVMLLSVALREWYGDLGVYLLAAASGIADVDAITLSLAGMVPGTLLGGVAAYGIVIAALVNTTVKGLLVVFIAGGSMARRTALAVTAVVLSGMAATLATAPMAG
jgi:uncharacterized membrane protein (DUF4010 family)